VQRSGDRIRVNVQLIDTQTGDHLWAEIYNRNLTASNVFAMQSEIVGTIARQLKANLTPRETRQLAAMPTTDLGAYTAYLRGRRESDIESVESLYQSIDSFRMAAELDPGFALAYVGLADAYLALGAYFYGGLPIDESVALAEPPLVRAIELNRNLGQAQATLGFLRQQQGDLQAAEHAYDRAIALQPSYSRVLRLYGRLRWQQGRVEDALRFLQRALTLDPFSAPVHFSIARIHDESGDFEAAMAGYRRVVEIEPDHAFAYVYIAAIHYLVYGRADESLVWYYKAAENDALSPSLKAALAIPYLVSV
jgi:adenylate cyclase